MTNRRDQSLECESEEKERGLDNDKKEGISERVGEILGNDENKQNRHESCIS